MNMKNDYLVRELRKAIAEKNMKYANKIYQRMRMTSHIRQIKKTLATVDSPALRQTLNTETKELKNTADTEKNLFSITKDETIKLISKLLEALK